MLGKQGFTLIEVTAALAILFISIGFITNLAVDYLSILNTIRQRYLALNFAQEGLELAFALRNKQIERGGSSWLGISSAGGYCFSFDPTTRTIRFQQSSSPCPITADYKRLITYRDFDNPDITDLDNSRAVRVFSEVFWGRNNRIKLDTVITRWHPNQ